MDVKLIHVKLLKSVVSIGFMLIYYSNTFEKLSVIY